VSIDIPPRGSRGANVPDLPKPLKLIGLKLFEIVKRLQRAPLGQLTTVGAKSGVERTVPLRRFDEGPGQWLVVASLGGAARNPAWLHNLAAHPDRATVEVGGRSVPVTATTLSGSERDAAWQRIVAAAPGFADYQAGTDRLIPVVRLTRRDPAA
jgi:deazaflavin-dependent oxidoreductase (nitroreductase family)